MTTSTPSPPPRSEPGREDTPRTVRPRSALRAAHRELRRRTARPWAEVTARWAALRDTHPITVLRWLRTGVLGTVVATALLCLLVAIQADRQEDAARDTRQSMDDIKRAATAASAADEALEAAFSTGQLSLTGTGSAFANLTAEVSTHITSAAEGNAAGSRGRTEFVHVQSTLTTCVQLATSAARDYAYVKPGEHTYENTSVHKALTGEEQVVDGEPVPGTGGLQALLKDLWNLEDEAHTRQLNSYWLHPTVPWALLAGPVIVMLGFTLATGHVLARRFRRHPDRRLVVALGAVAAGIGVALCRDVSVSFWQVTVWPRPHWLPLVLAMLLLAGAGGLAYRAYAPLLAEYRFTRS